MSVIIPPPLNSRKIEKQSNDFIATLKEEDSCFQLFQAIVSVIETSGIDLSKKQFKTESDTEMLVKALAEENYL